MPRLKADLHTHTADDPHDRIAHSSEMLIDAVAQLNFNVLAITCHERVVSSERLNAYAAERGVLLVPGVELVVEGKHVVVLNPDAEQAKARTFAELRRLGHRDGIVMAPHPFYFERSCVKQKLIEHIDVFDAIEFCSVYLPGIGMNGKAVEAARRYGLPLIGTSDTHGFPYCDSTFTWIEAEEATVPGVIEAIRAGRVTLETRPRPLPLVLNLAGYYLRDKLRDMGLRRG